MSMFSTFRERASSLVPRHALLVFEDSGNASRFAFTWHQVRQSAEGVSVGPGRLMTSHDQEELLAILKNACSTTTSFLPAEILSRSAHQVAWYVPAKRRRMWVRIGTQTRPYLVPWPTLLFCVRDGRLRLAAMSTNKRPLPTTPLFHAPLMNVYADTTLCNGTAALPSGDAFENRGEFERIVFETNFTHVNHGDTLRIRGAREVSTGAHSKFWRGLHDKRTERFPITALSPLRTTVAEWLDRSGA